MTDQEAKAVAALGLAISLWTVAFLIYRRFWTCEVQHRWKVTNALKVSDYRGRFQGWRGERECRRCKRFETIIIPRRTEKELML